MKPLTKLRITILTMFVLTELGVFKTYYEASYGAFLFLTITSVFFYVFIYRMIKNG
jgi:hypothetical protein